MKHEIVLEEVCTPEKFLTLLYQEYPYDIEEKMVFTLLEKDTYPHPALLNFISYYAHLPKYCLYEDDSYDKLTALCTKMSRLYQENESALHIHEFQFDAFLNVKFYKIKSPYAHLCLPQIPFLMETRLHTLPILQMGQPYRQAEITKSRKFLFKDISIDANDYIAISIKISDKHGNIYVPKTQMGIAIAITMLYEVCIPATDIDFILLYGLSAHEDTYAYYFDETNQIYTGLIAGCRYHHFIYVMQMITTLYNTICIEKQDLPVHACMLSMNFHGSAYGVVIMGDEHSGKSEVCDRLRTLCDKEHIPCSCIFEDSGTLHFLDNDISATGMQTGACVAIAGLPKERLFEILPACAFLQYEQHITHILFPFTSWKETCKFHKVHAFYYLSPHRLTQSWRALEQLEEVKQLFVRGNNKDGQKKGAYFCNRMGCEQQKEDMQQLIDQYFNVMVINEIHLGELSLPHMRKKRYLHELLQLWSHQKAKDN